MITMPGDKCYGHHEGPHAGHRRTELELMMEILQLRRKKRRRKRGGENKEGRKKIKQKMRPENWRKIDFTAKLPSTAPVPVCPQILKWV